MKKTAVIMGMPVTVEIVAQGQKVEEIIEKVFAYFVRIDNKFSTYKKSSEISRINQGVLKINKASAQTKQVLKLCQKMKMKTSGFFDCQTPDGSFDPSGLVKGWAIFNASKIIDQALFPNYFVSAGDDIQLKGQNSSGQPWKIGIRHPRELDKIVKVLYLTEGGVATSGNYLRGDHIYNPHEPGDTGEIISLTVIGPEIYSADVYATACFAMGKKGLEFLENLEGFEAYMIDKEGIARWSSGFEKYTRD